MADTATIASLATAGGTLVLAIATFSSTRSANRAARISEHALQAQLRPVMFTARPSDPPQKVDWIDQHRVALHNGLACVQELEGIVYLAIPLRNGGSGLGVLHAWLAAPHRAHTDEPRDIEQFRRLQRDLFVPAGDTGFWQAALRDPDDELRRELIEAIVEPRGITVEILYGDHEGGQRTVTRFNLTPRANPGEEPWLWLCTPARHFNIDRPPPR